MAILKSSGYFTRAKVSRGNSFESAHEIADFLAFQHSGWLILGFPLALFLNLSNDHRQILSPCETKVFGQQAAG
jgi:hypothetical protein